MRTSLPLLETMMTDRWLDGCLLDSDGRIFIDRDGDDFGDMNILKYLRGGADFLLELVRSSSSSSCASAAATRNYAVQRSGTIGGGLARQAQIVVVMTVESIIGELLVLVSRHQFPTTHILINCEDYAPRPTITDYINSCMTLMF